MRVQNTLQRKNLPFRAGFTLVEMMIIVMVIGVMAGLAAPPMFRFIQSNNLKTTTDRMTADMQYARSLAISDGRVLRFSAAVAGYQIKDPVSGQVLRSTNFKGGLVLDTAQDADFFPWGMADAKVFKLANSAGNKQINLLPTGLVEVH